MKVKVGTFNLNNLFSRFNIQANVSQVPESDSGGITMRFDEGQFTVRAFQGRLIKEKDQKDTEEIARRIRDVVDAEVLAVQEVEHVWI